MTNQEPTGTLPALLPNTLDHQCLDARINQEAARSHPLWIFRYITKNYHTNWTIKLDAKHNITEEIERQLVMGFCNLPPESKFLLEIDTSELLSSTIKSQQYCMYAIDAMQTAGERATKLSSGKTTSWNEIMSNGKFNYLPTQTP